MERFLDPKNDLIFKRLFGTEQHKDILIAFLNSVFEGVQAPIEDLSFIPTHQNPEIAALRESVIDVMCRSTDGREFIIEMQCTRDSSFIQRACMYVAKAYCSQDISGGYRALKPVIFFALIKGKLFPQKAHYPLHYQLRELYDGECDIQEFSFSFLELGKINKKLEDSKTIVEKWAYFFQKATETSPEDLPKITQNYPPLQSAYRVLAEHNYSREEMLEYHRYAMKADEIATGLSDAREEGEKIGLVKGKAETKREMVMSLYQQGVDKKIIVTAAQLSLEEIEQMLK
jgi:predicted transposase/invertase (TIGR01784 family)